MAKKDEKSKKNAPLIGIDIGGTGIKGGIVGAAIETALTHKLAK